MVHLQIPATSANLGAGFDSLGIAVTLYNQVNIDESEGVSITALDGAAIPLDESNLIYQTASRLFRLCGRPFRGLTIQQVNEIPMARGLGSSSACIVAGLLGANELMGRPLGMGDLLNEAAAVEGHPDNVAPALLGGMVTAVVEDGKVWQVKQELRDDLAMVAVVPDFPLKTADARAALPGEIPHRDGVYNLSRAALMAVSLASGRYENLAVACGDRLHQPYRLKLIPHGEEVLAICRELGAYGAYLSGAGSTLMALVPRSRAGFASELRTRLDRLGLEGWKIHTLAADNAGARVLPQSCPPAEAGTNGR